MTLKIVKTGKKNKTYFKPKSFINIKSKIIDKGNPKNIEIKFKTIKYLYSILFNKDATS